MLDAFPQNTQNQSQNTANSQQNLVNTQIPTQLPQNPQGGAVNNITVQAAPVYQNIDVNGYSTPTPIGNQHNSAKQPTIPAPVAAPVQQMPGNVVIDQSKSVSLANITREELILRRIIDDVTIQNRIMTHMTPDIFTGVNKEVCNAIIATHNKFNRFPTAAEIMQAMPDNAMGKSALQKIMLMPVDTIGKDITGEMVKAYFKEMLSEKIIIEAAVHINNNKIDNIAELVKKLENSINFNLDINIGMSARKNMKEIIERLNETLKAIPSAIADIRIETAPDPVLQIDGGGWFIGLSLFLGMPNVGKTICLCNEAAYSYMAGKNVLYISLEMDEAFIHQRIMANVCDTGMRDIKNQKWEEFLKKFESSKLPGVDEIGNVIVRRMPTTTTVTDIENLVEEIERSEGYKIDIAYVDYIGIMKPIKRANSIQNLNMYSMGREVAEQLRDFAYLHEIPVVTASQLNREGYANLQASMKDIAGSAGINDTADFMVTIMQDPMLKNNKMFMHTILKSRFGQNGTSFYTTVDYDKMRVRSTTPEEQEKYDNLRASMPDQTPITRPKVTVISTPVPKTEFDRRNGVEDQFNNKPTGDDKQEKSEDNMQVNEPKIEETTVDGY